MFYVSRILWISLLSWQSSDQLRHIFRCLQLTCREAQRTIVEDEGVWFPSVCGPGWRVANFGHWTGWQAWKYWSRGWVSSNCLAFGWRGVTLPVTCRNIIYDSAFGFRVKSSGPEILSWGIITDPGYLSLRVKPHPWVYQLSLLHLMHLVSDHSVPLFFPSQFSGDKYIPSSLKLKFVFEETVKEITDKQSRCHELHIQIVLAETPPTGQFDQIDLRMTIHKFHQERSAQRVPGRNFIQVTRGDRSIQWDLELGIHTATCCSKKENTTLSCAVLTDQQGDLLDLSKKENPRPLDHALSLQHLRGLTKTTTPLFPYLNEDHLCVEDVVLLLTPPDCPYDQLILRIRLDRMNSYQLDSRVGWIFALWHGDRFLSHYRLLHPHVKSKSLASTICPFWLDASRLFLLLISTPLDGRNLNGQILGRLLIDLLTLSV